MKKAYFSTIFFCAVLIFSIYSIPTNYGQAAFAHQDPAHEKCWTGGFTPLGGFKGGFFGPYDLISFIETVLVIALAILAWALIASGFFAAAGASIKASIPPIKVGFFVTKQISYVGGAALAAFGCEPLLVPPPVTEAGTVHLDCTNEGGFDFTNISSDLVIQPFSLHENSPVVSPIVETFGFFEPIIQATQGDAFDKVLPVVYWYAIVGPLLNILFPLIINLIFDILSLPSPEPDTPAQEGAEKAAKKTIKEKGKDFLTKQGKKILTSLSKNLLKAGHTVKTAPGTADFNPFSWQDRAEKTLPRDGYTTHPFHPILEGGVKDVPGGGTFELGKNSLTYFAKARLTDESIFPFNVYDSEAPEIIFRNETGIPGSNEVTLEANAHYGFKVNSRTLPLVKLGSTVFDKCDLNPTFDYIGPDFFLLTKIKENQYAPWKTTDHPPTGGYYALTPSDVIRVLDTEIETLTAADYLPTRTAGVDPSQTIEFSTVIEKFSTARHLFSVATNAEINELLANNTKKVPPTADLKVGNLADAITLDEIDILGSPKLDEEALTIEVKDDPLRLDNISEETKNALLALARDPSIVEDNTVIESVTFSPSSAIAWTFADSFLYGNARPSSIASTERPNPNVFADFQIITVLDTIAPNILVTEDIAIGVHNVTSTLTSQEDYPNLFDETGSCTGTEEADNIVCTLKIRPPAIFDIADPFPTIIFNITASKPSNSVPFVNLTSPDLVEDFPLGVSFINWKAVDFSDNGNEPEDIVTQIVNIKIEGTNEIPIVFDDTVNVFSTVPHQITLIANNTDRDPLKFSIEVDPEKGVIDTPLDAVFLTKFQLEGDVSKLTGITNEIIDINGDPVSTPGVFFTDSRNQRVLFLNQFNHSLTPAFLLDTPRPEGISLTRDGTFMIGDWNSSKILEVNNTGSTIKEFNISDLFVPIDEINRKMISVDQNNDDIYVTDQLGATITKLVDFPIFSGTLEGIEFGSGDSTVYVVEQATNLVHHFNSTGIFLDSIDSAFNNPTDVTVDSNGFVYVLDTGNDQIQIFNDELTKNSNFGPKGNGLNFFDSPLGIASNGTQLFVADTGNHQIKKITNTEEPFMEDYTDEEDWVTENGGTQIEINDFSSGKVEFSNESSVGAFNHVSKDLGSGFLDNLWSAEFDLDILPPAPNTSPVFLWLLTNNTQHPQESEPQDALGVIYENLTLKIFESHGNSNSTSTEISGLAHNEDYFITLEKLDSDLAAMAVYADKNPDVLKGHVVLNITSGISNLQVLQHANNSTSLEDTPKLTITETSINPVVTWLGKCTSGNNCDTNTNTSNEFSCTDASCFVTGGNAGTDPGQFFNPTGVSSNGTHIGVTDGHRVQIFNSTGIQTLSLGSSISGSGDLEFDSPKDIELASDGSIIVADTVNDRIKTYDASGTLKDIILEANGFGNFTFPSGVGVEPSGDIYVSDTDNNRIVKLDEDGGFVDLWESSISTRFDGFSDIFELYVPGIQAGALDMKDGKVYLGDWRPGEEQVIVANSLGGKIKKFDISSSNNTLSSIAVNNVADKIFVTNTTAQEIIVLDSDLGNEILPRINVTEALDDEGFVDSKIFPTGITTATNIDVTIGSPTVGITIPIDFVGEKLYVYGNSTEKIYAMSDDGSDAKLAFNAKDLFSNLNDITVNATHVFGLNEALDENATSKIIQIRWDKGIQEIFDTGVDVTGITIGKDIDSDFIFYTTQDLLFKLNTTDNAPPADMFDLGTLVDPETDEIVDPPVKGSGVAINPDIAQLVNVTIPDDAYNLFGPRGLTFNGSNQMFVSSAGTDDIKVLNATTFGFIQEILSPDLVDPTDIVIGPNGTLLIASSANHSILEYNGTDTESLVTGNDGIVFPTGLAISPDEQHLFVSNGYDNTIKKVKLFSTTTLEPIHEVNAADGTKVMPLNVIATTPVVFPEDERGFVSSFVNVTNKESLRNPQYLAFGPHDDKLYVSSFESNEILRWNLDGTFEDVFVNSTATELLDGPTGIVFDEDKEIMYVGSAKTNKVLQFNSMTGEFIDEFSDEQTLSPDGLALGPDGNLFVSSVGSNEVLEYGDSDVRLYISDWNSPDDRIISLNATFGVDRITDVSDLLLGNPGNIVTDSNGRLWIADTGKQELVQINVVANNVTAGPISTKVIVEIEAPELTKINGTDNLIDNEGTIFDEEIQNVTSSVIPEGLSVDNNDNLYLTDWLNHRIVVLDPTGTTFLGQVRLNSTFTDPMDITINQTSPGKLDDIWVYDKEFEEDENNKFLISLDVEKQFEILEFTKELSPLLRGLTTNNTSLVTTPENSGSLLEVRSNKTAVFDSRHFIIPLGIDLVKPGSNNTGIYVTDWKENRIVKLDYSGDFVQDFNIPAENFVINEPGDIEVNVDDEFFWITEPRRATIDQIDFNGTLISFPSVGDKYVFMSAVDADKQDNFYVISNQNSTIQKFDIRGTKLADAIAGGFNLNATQTMEDISLGSADSESVLLVLAEKDKDKIIRFNSDDLTFISSKPIDIEPTSVAADNDGFVYISNSSQIVTRLNADLTKNGTFNINPIPGNQGGMIDDMVIDSKNNLYAADFELDRIYKYNLTDIGPNGFIGWLGKCTTSDDLPDLIRCDTDSMHSNGFACTDSTCSNNDSSFGRDVGQFFEPASLAIDGLDNVYVGDIKLARDIIEDGVSDPVVTKPIDPITGLCPDGFIENEEKKVCESVFNKGTVPRVQKFTQNGFFVEQVISNTNQTLVKGNFFWIQSLAFGTNNFYVADVEKLHVFDVNPFFNIITDLTTNQTNATLTYQSFTDLGMNEMINDTFKFRVFDGFNFSNTAQIDIVIQTEDEEIFPEKLDGILGDIDEEPFVDSLNFTAPATNGIGGANGRIVDVGKQILTIREDRDFTKGVYAQARIEGGGDIAATIRFCDDLAEVKLVPGNRLTATCTMGGANQTEPVGVELDILRGKIDVTFFDREGRSSNSKILLENSIHFAPIPFEFVTPETNLDRINQTVTFNGKMHSYLVPRDSQVRIDTAPPILPEADCNTPLTIEAGTRFGVDLSSDAIHPDQANKIAELSDWLTFNATEVDNGSTPETDGDDIPVTASAKLFVNAKFPHNGTMTPTPTVVEFTAIDKIGNNSTCTNIVNVRDTTAPVLEDLPDITNIMTGDFSEVGNGFFALPEIFDLPFFIGDDNLDADRLVDLKSKCTPVIGSEFRIGNTTVVCIGYDLSGNSNHTSFTVEITPNPDGLRIKNVTAAGNAPGFNNGDKVFVEFTVPTNEPPVATTADLDTLFNVTNGNLTGTSGKFLDPSTLLITIKNATSADLDPGTTVFDLRFTDDHELLQSASGSLNSTGFNNRTNPVTLTGNFSSPLAPYITSFMVTDPSVEPKVENDDEYSTGDKFTIRFSEPTNAPNIGEVLSKNLVKNLFDFLPHDLGEDYVGAWKNPSTFIITITDKTEDPTKKPTLGSTLAKVVGGIKNKAGTSLASTSISPPLSGSFGLLYSIIDVDENRTFVQDLPSGLKLGIKFPIINSILTTTNVTNNEDFIINLNSTTVFSQESGVEITRQATTVSEQLDIMIANPDDCLLGCEISFYIHESDLPSRISLDELRIFHDENDDGLYEVPEELLVPSLEKINDESYRVSVTITSFSTIALVGVDSSGGGGGDGTPPIIHGASLGGGGSLVDLDEIHFENVVEKSIIKVGEEYKVKVTLYENSGPDALQHISLYVDLTGFEREVHQSDAYIRYDKGIGVTAYDPQNLFRETDIFILKNGANLEIEFTIIFDRPMDESDLIVRAWDEKKNSVDARFSNALEVIPEDLSVVEIPPEVIDEGLLSPEFEITIDKITFEKWSGFSEESISDSELLALMGIDGDSIPEWYKEIVIKWIRDGIISYEEFVNALIFFEKQGLLGNS